MTWACHIFPIHLTYHRYSPYHYQIFDPNRASCDYSIDNKYPLQMALPLPPYHHQLASLDKRKSSYSHLRNERVWFVQQ
ncbi:hypothetical protein HanXRQr2_Chr13g0598001 [Helianthus annuus]|uniref:Uncharacterized protein n=1 Tax=Helianthus annuus TaxID=4232 RepID=A0A9K3EI65_HELAN|nr:hypothetical protein HanXRQr2_Chr13g0598001 [Helianthus annuus]KAJ0850051.1 hypothetical protein HanPSC8_Chr13g0576071 [Helianthus annuus]